MGTKDQPYSHPFWNKEGSGNPYRNIDKEKLMEILPSSKQVGGTHYKDLAIQPIHFSERNKLTPMEHTAIKYITRHRFKGTGKQDIEKAIHTLNLILEEYYPIEGLKK